MYKAVHKAQSTGEPLSVLTQQITLRAAKALCEALRTFKRIFRKCQARHFFVLGRFRFRRNGAQWIYWKEYYNYEKSYIWNHKQNCIWNQLYFVCNRNEAQRLYEVTKRESFPSFSESSLFFRKASLCMFSGRFSRHKNNYIADFADLKKEVPTTLSHVFTSTLNIVTHIHVNALIVFHVFTSTHNVVTPTLKNLKSKPY